MLPIPSLKLIGYCALGMLVAGLMLALGLERRHSRHLQASVTQLTALRVQDAANFKAAAVQAQAANKATIAKVETQQATITKESTDAYQTNLAALRAASRVRAASQADPGRAHGSGASQVSIATGGPDGPNRLLFPAEQLLRAQEIELQLMALQDWNRKQASIDPNAP